MKRTKLTYEVMVFESQAYNSVDCFISLGEYEAWTPRAAANKALRDLAKEPFDSEGASMLGGPDRDVFAIPTSLMRPLKVRMPKALLEAIAEGSC